MRIKIIIFLALCIIFKGYSQNYFSTKDFLSNNQSSPITDPSISLRCRNQIEKRTKKILHKNNLESLLKRTESLIKRGPSNKKIALTKLRTVYDKIDREVKFSKLVIKNLEETIIRSGCPGINLSQK